jgi:hypothetical protein
VAAKHPSGLLNPRELDYYGYGDLQNDSFGTRGYVIYDWSSGSDFENLTGGFTLTPQSGWTIVQNLEREYAVNTAGTNVQGSNWGVVASPSASINIHAADTNFHYLTVISPDQFNEARNFTMQLQSTNGMAAVYTVNESPGYSHVFQFRFKGDVTLWASGTNAILQALFFDDFPVTFVTVTNTTLTTPLVLANATIAGDGTFQFSFSNSQAVSFTVLSTTNLSLPLSDWTVLGPPSNTAPGMFQFTAQTPTNDQQRYYFIRSP